MTRGAWSFPPRFRVRKLSRASQQGKQGSERRFREGLTLGHPTSTPSLIDAKRSSFKQQQRHRSLRRANMLCAANQDVGTFACLGLFSDETEEF